MTTAETLQKHQILCDEIHQLALEENRFLKQFQRVPDTVITEKKRELLARLESSLGSLKEINAELQATGATRTPGVDKVSMEKLRSRIMQILLLDRENEQLLIRYSLGGAAKPPSVPPPPSRLQQLYGPTVKS